MNKNSDNKYIEVPESFKLRIRTTLDNLPEKEITYKKEQKPSKLPLLFNKRAIVGLASVVLISTTAYAMSQIKSQVSISSNIPTYTSIPSENVLNKDVGFAPNIVDEFDNGLKFKSGHIGENQAFDENDEVVAEYKDLHFEYQSKDGKVSIFTSDIMVGERDASENIVDTYKESSIYYLESTYKFVPEDYKMTKQDKKDEASGKYIFSYGSDEVEISKNQHISFEYKGIHYSILASDSDLTQDELVEMAKEIIDNK